METTTKSCAICGNPRVPDKARHCVACNGFDGAVYKAVAQLAKAAKIANALASVGAIGVDIAEMSASVRRITEDTLGLSESSDSTWAMAAYLLKED